MPVTARVTDGEATVKTVPVCCPSTIGLATPGSASTVSEAEMVKLPWYHVVALPSSPADVRRILPCGAASFTAVARSQGSLPVQASADVPVAEAYSVLKSALAGTAARNTDPRDSGDTQHPGHELADQSGFARLLPNDSTTTCHYGSLLGRVPASRCDLRPSISRWAHHRSRSRAQLRPVRAYKFTINDRGCTLVVGSTRIERPGRPRCAGSSTRAAHNLQGKAPSPRKLESSPRWK